MPRYFIDTHDGDAHHMDRQGRELTDDAAAREAALDVLPDMARNKLPDGDCRTFVVSARNAEGIGVYKATLRLEGEWLVQPPTDARVPHGGDWPKRR